VDDGRLHVEFALVDFRTDSDRDQER